MATEKKKKTIRAPRTVWVTFTKSDWTGIFPTKKAALASKWEDETVVGPYILAERVVNK